MADAMWFACEVSCDHFPWLEAIDQPSRVIGFMELLATTVAISVWGGGQHHISQRSAEQALAVSMNCIPICSDNLGNVFIVKNFYTATMPLGWMLQELALQCIRRGVKPCLAHRRGDADCYTDTADKLSRGLMSLCPNNRVKVDLKTFPWISGIALKTVKETSHHLRRKDVVREARDKRKAEGGESHAAPARIPKRRRAIRKQERRFRELEIARQIDAEELIGDEAKGGGSLVAPLSSF